MKQSLKQFNDLNKKYLQKKQAVEAQEKIVKSINQKKDPNKYKASQVISNYFLTSRRKNLKSC